MAPVAIVQARMNSTRLPGKVMMEIGGRPIIDHVLDALRKSNVGRIIVAMPTGDLGSHLWRHLCQRTSIVRGPEHDVAARFLKAARDEEYFMRVCADSPLLSPNVINLVIDAWEPDRIVRSTGTHGQQVEIVPTAWLKQNHQDMNEDDREHVTPFFYRNNFPVTDVPVCIPFGGVVDTQEDLENVRRHYESLRDRSGECREVPRRGVGESGL